MLQLRDFWSRGLKKRLERSVAFLHIRCVTLKIHRPKTVKSHAISTGCSGQTFLTLTAGSLDGVVYTGTAGTDSLTATVTNADDNGAAVTMSGIENMTVRVSGAGGVELLMGDASGIETFTANRLGSNLTLTDATDLATDLVIANQSTTAILDVNYEAGVVAGDADSVNLTVNRTTDAEADLDGVEVVNLTSTNAPADAANVLDLSGAGMETVNVTADADLTLAVDDAAEVNVSGSADVTVTLAATTDSTVTSTGTGALTVNANGAADLTLTGGTGDDTFAMGTTLTADDVIDGGDGADTLRVTGAGGAVIPAAAQITNVETLRVTTGGADTFDASIVAFDNVTVISAADAHSFAATEITTETISITHADDAGAGVTDIAGVNINLADATGTADSVAPTPLPGRRRKKGSPSWAQWSGLLPLMLPQAMRRMRQALWRETQRMGRLTMARWRQQQHRRREGRRRS